MNRSRLLAATSLATTLVFLVPGMAFAQAVHDWSGFYLGLGVNVTSSKGTIGLDYNFQGNSPDLISIPMLGANGTITGGYNFQSGGFVYGIEADGTPLSLTGYASGTGYSAGARLETLLSLRGRLGIASGPLLYYMTGGLAAGRIAFDANIEDSAGNALQVAEAQGAGIVFGPVGGAGAEYAVNDNMSLKLEGLVSNIGPVTATGDNGKGAYTATARNTSFAVKGGVNFHFK